MFIKSQKNHCSCICIFIEIGSGQWVTGSIATGSGRLTRFQLCHMPFPIGGPCEPNLYL